MTHTYPNFSGIATSDARWFRMFSDIWSESIGSVQEVYAAQGTPWPDGLVFTDLNYIANELAAGRRVQMPSRETLASRWGWSAHRVRALVEHPERWCVPEHLAAWEAGWKEHAVKKVSRKTRDERPTDRPITARPSPDRRPIAARSNTDEPRVSERNHPITARPSPDRRPIAADDLCGTAIRADLQPPNNQELKNSRTQDPTHGSSEQHEQQKTGQQIEDEIGSTPAAVDTVHGVVCPPPDQQIQIAEEDRERATKILNGEIPAPPCQPISRDDLDRIGEEVRGMLDLPPQVPARPPARRMRLAAPEAAPDAAPEPAEAPQVVVPDVAILRRRAALMKTVQSGAYTEDDLSELLSLHLQLGMQPPAILRGGRRPLRIVDMPISFPDRGRPVREHPAPLDPDPDCIPTEAEAEAARAGDPWAPEPVEAAPVLAAPPAPQPPAEPPPAPLPATPVETPVATPVETSPATSPAVITPPPRSAQTAPLFAAAAPPTPPAPAALPPTAPTTAGPVLPVPARSLTLAPTVGEIAQEVYTEWRKTHPRAAAQPSPSDALTIGQRLRETQRLWEVDLPTAGQYAATLCRWAARSPAASYLRGENPKGARYDRIASLFSAEKWSGRVEEALQWEAEGAPETVGAGLDEEADLAFAKLRSLATKGYAAIPADVSDRPERVRALTEAARQVDYTNLRHGSVYDFERAKMTFLQAYKRIRRGGEVATF